MKITFVLPGIDISGGIRSTFELSDHLQRLGNEVNIVYSKTPWAYDYKNVSLKHKLKGLKERLKGVRKNIKVDWFDLKVNLIRVPRLIDKYIPPADVVVATWWGNAYDIHRFKPNKGKKFYYIRSYEIWCGPEDMVHNTYNLPHIKIAVSNSLKNFIESKFKVSVYDAVGNGVNFDLFYQTNNFDCHQPRRIGMCYRQSKIKGMRDGFKAFILAKEKYPDIKLVLFGENLSREDKGFLSVLNNESLEHHYLPFKEDLRKIYNSLDVFVLPSHLEGYARIPTEVMACGTACVTTDVGGIRQYAVDGESVLISPVKDYISLSKNLTALLQNEKERKRIAQNGYNYIKQFTWEKIATKLESIFRNCL